VGIEMTPLLAAVVTFSIQSAAFFAEVFRAGIVSIERGQWEAARAIGMNGAQTMRRIILPQALKRMTPALTNRAIEIFKMTTLASAIAYVELLQQAKLIASLNFNPIEAYTAVAVIFFVFLWPLVQLTYVLERRLARDE
jgi:polar amino acid transport system permease protein